MSLKSPYNPNRTTVFSTNPKTGQPYISPQIAQKMAGYHILNRSSNLRKHEPTDLIQDIMVRLCELAYNPEKSAPSTWVTMVCNSTAGQRSIFDKCKGRKLVQSDFYVIGGDEPIMASDLLVEQITPFDILKAKQALKSSYETEVILNEIQQWKKENLVKDLPKKRNGRKIHDSSTGITYPSATACAISLGIPYQTLMSSLREQNKRRPNLKKV